MVVIGFPVMVKREHFKSMRDLITTRMKASSFEEAFYFICSRYNEKYSQFDIIVHYLWNYKRDEYSWHLVDGSVAKHLAFTKRMSEKKHVLEMNDPIIGLMKHGAFKF